MQVLPSVCEDEAVCVAAEGSSLYPRQLVPSCLTPHFASQHKPPRSSPTMDTTAMCRALLYLKETNPDFSVFKVFKRYLDCKEKALKSYNEELGKESFITSSEKCNKEMIDILDDSIESVNNSKMSSTSPAAIAPTKRKRRTPVTSGKRRRFSKCKKSRLSNEDAVDCSDHASVESPSENKSEGDNEHAHQTPVPIWAAYVPYHWTDIFAPTSSDDIIGSEGQ